jgi:hypothetical protein
LKENETQEKEQIKEKMRENDKLTKETTSTLSHPLMQR